MLDLLITNATLPDGRTGMSIAVQNGKITAVERRPAGNGQGNGRRQRQPAQPALRATRTSTWTPR
jgi:hypothetical protein